MVLYYLHNPRKLVKHKKLWTLSNDIISYFSGKKCAKGMTKCDDGLKCIYDVEFCDEEVQCLDKSDEKPDLCQGMCLTSVCINIKSTTCEAGTAYHSKSTWVHTGF